MERLQKFMSRHGLASRRACEEIIASGKVKVNGKIVTTPGTLVDPAKVRVEVDGRRLVATEQKVYILLNKPRGYLSTVKDPRGRKIVTDLLKDVKERVYPVGRLDYDSEGLLLLTNDGELAYWLTHPGHSVPKTYKVRIKGIPTRKELETLAEGVMLEDGVTAPAEISLIDQYEGNALLEVTISEGRNRQIRRMMETVGHEVLRLKRTRVGSLSLGDLKSGRYRHLKDNEVQALFKKFGMKKEKTRVKFETTRPKREKFGVRKDNSGAKKENAGPKKDNARPGKDNAGLKKNYAGLKKDSTGSRKYNAGPKKDNTGQRKDNAGPKKESPRGRNKNFGKGGIIKKRPDGRCRLADGGIQEPETRIQNPEL